MEIEWQPCNDFNKQGHREACANRICPVCKPNDPLYTFWTHSPTLKKHSNFRIITAIFEPSHEKINKMTCVPSEDSDQPGHPPSLSRVFAVHSVDS